ncbi:uncharacterized protein LOC108088480 [Drosophila ficusphila]|uniref:uncharacterized protein LOC108088480 n=1 Tax=Drosophila ficusphila TaxID=30025 RepID=UPI0007E64FEE|nr:uncharacterized protein LOC108088480 [Drosophila ficusphila]
MCAKFFWLGLIACLVLAKSGDCFQAKRFFGVGKRIDGDQLLVKDVLYSRPAGVDELPRVTFTYEIQEPITCIEIYSEENISAEVRFSLVNHQIVGLVQLAGGNQSFDPSVEVATVPPISGFDVTIMVFGLDENATIFDPSLIINRNQQYEGDMEPYEQSSPQPDEYVEVFDNNRRDALEVDEEVENLSEEEVELFTEGPLAIDDFEKPDKNIEIGNRQAGDQLLYECYMTGPDNIEQATNQSVTFYYIDSNCITYVKFVVLGSYDNKTSGAEYTSPVAEYSHFSSGTLKAVITHFTSNLFVQMFVYGYWGREAPAGYVPFLPPPQLQRTAPGNGTPHLTPLQTMQLLLLTGQRTTPAPEAHNDILEPELPRSILPEEMVIERIDDESNSSAFRQKESGLGALLGLLLLILHN